ncbi:HEPN domain-containing protein [Candidatus Micrarchaeota archaeon]|nr:HEPN domain-containing protein [Candidatus Micrarchaeota archaeon]MBU2476596.1 HEPN domain-containing protein [Candidatus Micrarchaeota archaeon]
MKIEDCLQQGLLVKIKSDAKKAKMSVEMAEHKLQIAEKEFDYKIFENAIISAYTSMFHSARALLFKDGFKERSHFAVFVYIKEKYSEKIEKKYLTELNSLRLHRHDLMYGLEKPSEIQETEADSTIKVAEEFLKAVKIIIQENKPESSKKK